jgi:hypothetical protein
MINIFSFGNNLDVFHCTIIFPPTDFLFRCAFDGDMHVVLHFNEHHCFERLQELSSYFQAPNFLM